MSALLYATPEAMRAWAAVQMVREPDYVIGDPAAPYMRRWFIVPRNEQCNVYLHGILRSDDDRALHDHPWPNTSYVIDGEYDEITPVYPNDYMGPGSPGSDLMTIRRRAGAVVSRPAQAAHRLVLPEGGRCVSLFITGQKLREWGFWCAKGWVHWRDFTSGENGEIVGRGCGER